MKKIMSHNEMLTELERCEVSRNSQETFYEFVPKTVLYYFIRNKRVCVENSGIFYNVRIGQFKKLITLYQHKIFSVAISRDNVHVYILNSKP